MLRNRKGDICEDTSLLYRRTSPMFGSLDLGPEPLAKEHTPGHSANTAKAACSREDQGGLGHHLEPLMMCPQNRI